MAFLDKTLACRNCEAEFVFTAGEQEFYEQHGLKNAPSGTYVTTVTDVVASGLVWDDVTPPNSFVK